MNILYLHCHDAGRYLGVMGQPVPTPSLSRLAERATLFRQAFCAAPTCSPSRAALLTGLVPHETGMLGLAHRGFQLSQPERHLANHLKRQGFQTALAGIQHEFATAPAEIYDEIFEASCQKGEESDRATATWAAQWLTTKKDRPCFLSCGFFLPHREFPKANIPPDHLVPPPPIPDCAGTREDAARYLAAAQIMDECCGEVLEALSSGPHAENTIIIFTTDHGPAFPFMKCTLTDAGLGVALLVDFPDNPIRGRSVDAMVSHLDIFPTVCDLLDLPSLGGLRGRSLLPLFRGQVTRLHEELFGEVTFHASYEPMRSLRTERYKLIELFDADTRPLPANVDPSPTKDLLAAGGFFETRRDRVQLYDLLLDPQEKNQLAEIPEYAAILKELRARLRRWMEETDDPLRSGTVAPPVGANITPRQADGTESADRSASQAKPGICPPQGGSRIRTADPICWD